MRERLGGEHVLDLARTDAEGERTKGAVGAGVAVTAHHGHARKRQAQFGAHHVDDALVLVPHRIVRDAELGRVRPQRLDLLTADLIGDRQVLILGRHVVVLGRDCQVGPANRAAGHAQAFERLGRGDLVDQMQVDVEEGRAVVFGLDDVVIPNLLAQRSRVSGSAWLAHASIFTISTAREPPGAS